MWVERFSAVSLLGNRMLSPCCHDVSNVAMAKAIRVQICETQERSQCRSDKSHLHGQLKEI